MTRLRRSFLSIAALIASAFAILPPAGFALCVDSDGHLVVEADAGFAGRCCFTPSAAADESCRPDDCATCLDIAIAGGDVLRAAGTSDLQPQILPAPTPPDAIVAVSVRLPAHVAGLMGSSPGPRTPGVSLRL